MMKMTTSDLIFIDIFMIWSLMSNPNNSSSYDKIARHITTQQCPGKITTG